MSGDDTLGPGELPATLARVDRRAFLQMTAGVAAALPMIACGADAVAPPTQPALAPEPENTPDTPTAPGDRDPPRMTLDPQAVRQDDQLFPNANLVGSMKTTSVFMAAHFADLRGKTLLVWKPTGDGNVPVHEAFLEPDAHGYAQAPVNGLEPGQWYRYAYFSGEPEAFDARSLIGSFRTALPEDSREPVTIAISACNGGRFDPNAPPAGPYAYPALETTATQYYDAFIHLGDQAYLDDVFATGGSKGAYLNAWKYYLGSTGMRAAYAQAGMYCTWDDHEVTDNGDVNPWSDDPYDIERIRNGRAAYFRAMPLEPHPEDPMRLWRSFRWGRTVELILLDSRYERNEPSSGLYISAEQMEWFKGRLRDSPCHFKVIGNSVPMTDMPFYFDLVNKNDRWEGYAAQRQELLDFIEGEAIENVWFLSGDVHTNFVSKVETSGLGPAGRVREITVTGGNTSVPVYGSNIQWSRAAPRACLITFFPDGDEVNVRYINPETGEIDYEADLSRRD